MRPLVPLIALLVATTSIAPATGQEGPAAGAERSLRIEASQIAPRFDSLEIRAAGRAAGWQVARVATLDGGLHYEEVTSVGPSFQRTVVEFDRAGTLRSVSQRGTAGGKEMRIDLRYGDRAVSGRSLTPLAEGEVQIDAPLPEGTIDDNGLQAVLPWLAWSEDAEWSFPMFSSGKGTVAQRTLRVVGVERVSVPAGDIRAYRAELGGEGAPVEFWVSVEAPHRLVKLAVPGSPVEFLRVR